MVRSMVNPDVIILKAVLFFPLIISLIISSFALGQTHLSCTGDNGNATLARQNNFNHTLSDLNAQSSKKRYYANSYGNGSDTVYAFYMCWGLFNPKDCRSCVATLTAVSQCDPTEGSPSNEECVLLYSNNSTYRNYSIYPNGFPFGFGQPLGGKLPNYQEYSQTLSSTLDDVIKEAAFNSSNNGSKLVGFATKEVNVTAEKRIHSVAQCIPDIVGVDCADCLRDVLDAIRSSSLFNGTEGAIYTTSFCQLQYSFLPFSKQGTSEGKPLRPAANCLVVHAIVLIFICYIWLPIIG